MIQIRHAGPEDAQAIIGHILASHQEIGRQEPPSIRRIQEMVELVLAEEIVVLADRQGEQVGSLGLMAMRFWYSDQQFLTDRWFYVRPEARAGRTARKMLNEARSVAKLAELHFYPAVTPGPGRKLAVITRLYSMAGFQPMGIWFQEGR